LGIEREALNCLMANRSTLFVYDPTSEVLKAQFKHALEPRNQRVGMVEEKERGKKGKWAHGQMEWGLALTRSLIGPKLYFS